MVKFKYYKTAATYGTAGESIASDDIVFIEETNTLHTHEHDYVFGNAYTDMWLKQAALGSTTEPVYLSAKGEFSKASKYAGGTAVTLNGTSAAASTASFYAPTGAGTSGQILKSNGSGAPSWVNWVDNNTATLKVSDTTNKKISTTESSSAYISFAGGTNKFTVSDGTNSFDVAVTPSISNNVTGSGLTADKIVLGNGSSAIKTSSKGITATAPSSSSDDTTLPTSKAVWTAVDARMPKSGGTFTGAVTLNADPTSNLHAATKQYVDNQITSKIAAADAMVFKGTLGTGGNVTALPTSGVVVGDTYKVITAGTYASQAAKIGDLFIATASTPTWAYVPSGDEVVTTVKTGTSNLSTTAQSGELIVGTAATKAFETTLTNGGNLPTGAAVKSFVEGKGYVTSSGITSISGTTGVSASTSGGTTTVKAALKEETANSADSTRSTSTSGGLYAVEVDKSGKLAVRVPWTDHTYTIPTVGDKALKIASGSGTATQAITMNESSADKTLTITGDGTYITGAVSGSTGAPTVTLSHAGPSTGSALTTSNGTAGSYALNTEYTVLTGVTVSADAKGHITGISTTRQKIKDTNTTYTFDGTYNASTNKAATVSTVTTAVTNGLTWSEYN